MEERVLARGAGLSAVLAGVVLATTATLENAEPVGRTGTAGCALLVGGVLLVTSRYGDPGRRPA